MHRSISRLLIAVVGLISLSACDSTTIDPFDNDERYFTVYGYLDQLETRHTIRVVPISRFAENILAEHEPQGTIDAQVFTTDLYSGTRTKWEHEFSPLEDGTYGHVFYANFIVNPGREYLLEVVRSDGKMATATTQVPKIDDSFHIQKGPEVYANDSTLVYQDVVFPEIDSPWSIQAIYFWGANGADQRLFVPYDRTGEQLPEGGWKVRMNISDDQYWVEQDVAWSRSIGWLGPTDEWGLNSIGFQVRVLDDNWNPPGGEFDPNVLAQPDAMSNVENGQGFFGSIGIYYEEWNAQHLSLFFGHPY